MCKLGERCHVNAKGHDVFGTAFPQEKVRAMAASSVALLSDHGPEPGSRVPWRPFASGTLIWNNVVLCAGHSVLSLNPKNIRVRLFHECDEATAPVDRWEGKDLEGYRSCNMQPQPPLTGGVSKVLEEGAAEEFDYALLAVDWSYVDQYEGITLPPLKVPRRVQFARPSSELTEELLLIAHPHPSDKVCQPTQGAPAKLFKRDRPNPFGEKTKAYGLAAFNTSEGASGGGVFNSKGEIVAVYCGTVGHVKAKVRDTQEEKENAGKMFFLQLAAAAIDQAAKAAKDSAPVPRLARWVAGRSPLLSGDPVSQQAFLMNPPPLALRR